MGKSVAEIRTEIESDINKVINTFETYKEDGFTISEVAKFVFEAGTELVEAVEDVEGLTGAQKKEFVQITVKDIYKEVNPDIPWIPEPFETMLENILLDQSLDKFIDFIVKRYKKKGVFN